MPNHKAGHWGFGQSKKIKPPIRLFKNKKAREKFAKRDMNDVLDNFFKSKIYREKFTPLR